MGKEIDERASSTTPQSSEERSNLLAQVFNPPTSRGRESQPDAPKDDIEQLDLFALTYADDNGPKSAGKDAAEKDKRTSAEKNAKLEKQAAEIADDIKAQKYEPIELPKSFRDTVDALRKSAKDHKDFDNQIDVLVGKINQNLAPHPEFLEIKHEGPNAHISLLRHHNWREHQDMMHLRHEHVPINSAQNEHERAHHQHLSTTKDGKSLDIKHLQAKDYPHLQTNIARACNELREADFIKYLDHLKKESDGKIYYSTNSDYGGLGKANIRVYVNDGRLSHTKLFDRNSQGK